MGVLQQWGIYPPDVNVGDRVETPYGDAIVVEVSIAQDMFWAANVETGIVLEWQQSEVETLAEPDMSDHEAVERWLSLAAIVVPRLTIEETTTRCQTEARCQCRYCYVIVKSISGRGMQPRTEVSHFADSAQCHCLPPPGSRNRDCTCLDNVTRRFVP